MKISCQVIKVALYIKQKLAIKQGNPLKFIFTKFWCVKYCAQIDGINLKCIYIVQYIQYLEYGFKSSVWPTEKAFQLQVMFQIL